MNTIGEALAWGRAQLGGDPEAASEAQLLLGHVLEHDAAWLYAWPEQALNPAQREHYRELIQGRAAGEPVAYLIGRREFWSLPLGVDRHTLIPRPETEHLVEFILRTLPREHPLRVIDLGTGSGAIALALASERPAWRISASDRSASALHQARRNARDLGLTIEWIQADWLKGIEGPFDLVVSNPPYVAEDDPHLQRGDLRFEPRDALASGPDGLDAIRRLISQAPSRLAPGGRLVFEHGCEQGTASRTLLAEAGFTDIGTGRDLADLERFSHGCRPSSI
jgi:release factor glutamine methyltransferase